MRTLIILSVILFVTIRLLAQEPEPDPLVWKKHIGGIVRAVTFSPDGEFIYVAATGFKPMKLLTETGDIVMEYEGLVVKRDVQVEMLDISRDGRRLFVADSGNTLFVWDTQTGALLHTLDAGYEEWRAKWYHSITVSENYIAALVAYSLQPETTYPVGGEIHIWDVNTYEKVKVIEPSYSLIKIKFSDDDRFLAKLVGEPDHNDETGTVLLNSGTWDTFGSFWGHEYGVNYCAFSPDGTMMATCSWGYQVKVWDVAERKLITDIETHWYQAESVIFTDNEHIFSGNGVSKIFNDLQGWELQNYKEVFNYESILPRTIDYNLIMNKICCARSNDIVLLKPINTTSIYEPFKQSLTASPNPTNNSIKVSFNLPKSGLTNVEISNVNSRMIRKLHTGFLESGQHNFDWDTKAIPAGVYFCKISSKEFNESVKIIVEK
ncbi:MAG: T9SS type A sorting domain-containing protein [Desulfobulbaceae bacterium]|nr:T9SS type A sorting domain-containing protein [Desulfobulbaceae bacterium]